MWSVSFNTKHGIVTSVFEQLETAKYHAMGLFMKFNIKPRFKFISK